ncbi:MAG: cupin [Gammaproteobacteria bacterium]|nr:cupin [Gammaproteobacteria bacterium]
MSQLKIFPENNPQAAEIISNFDEMASRLHGIGVRFERWQAHQPLSDGASQDDVLAAYRGPVDRLMKEYNFKSADVISLRPDHPDKVALRNKFLDEHAHSDFEVRFFVDGLGLFYIHAHQHVYGVLCEKGDLISVPADTKHWFDMGPQPQFKCIRLFTTPEGWVAKYTGDTIAKKFPTLDQF